MNIIDTYNNALARDSAEFERLAPNYFHKVVSTCGGSSVLYTLVDLEKLKADHPDVHLPWWAEMYAVNQSFKPS